MEYKKGIKAPVLLIGFNRPDTMQQVFDAVRIAMPEKLYYAVDGARPDKGEEARVQQVREIVEQVDWPCEVHTLFREENAGCGFGPAGAINWAFENEDRLIVLEDDCVPSQSFFSFCNELLERYKDDERVNMISGRSKLTNISVFEEQDYVFTRHAPTWGWASWKRCWKEFDIKMKDFPLFLQQGGAFNIYPMKKEAKNANQRYLAMYERIEEECTHSWDGQWAYARLKSGALGIVPSHNLILNIGMYGTHSNGHQEVFDLQAEEMPIELRHPLYILPNMEYENIFFKRFVFRPLHKKIINRLLKWIKLK